MQCSKIKCNESELFSFQVSIYLVKRHGDDYCTYSNFGLGSSLYKVKVDGHGATSVSFPIIPTEVGYVPVQVTI